MPLDAGHGPKPADTDTELDDLRRRAGITPAYAELNPPPIMVPMSQGEIIALLAALQQIENAQEMVPIYSLMQKFKRLVPNRPQSSRPKPSDKDNPYYLASLEKR